MTARLKEALEIRNEAESAFSVDEACGKEIEEYLSLLVLIKKVAVVSISDLGKKKTRTLISQPGLRYTQANALIESLLTNQIFASLSITERNAVSKRIRNEIKERIMEGLVLFKAKMFNPDKEIFLLQFPVGEFDMVVFSPHVANCRI